MNQQKERPRKQQQICEIFKKLHKSVLGLEAVLEQSDNVIYLSGKLQLSNLVLV